MKKPIKLDALLEKHEKKAFDATILGVSPVRLGLDFVLVTGLRLDTDRIEHWFAHKNMACRFQEDETYTLR